MGNPNSYTDSEMALPLFNAVPKLSPAFLPSEETNIHLPRIDLGRQTGNEQGR